MRLYICIMPLKPEKNYKRFDDLISGLIPFALFRLPGEQTIRFIQQTTLHTSLFADLSCVDVQQGFMVAPFHFNQANPIIVIRPDVYLDNEASIFNHLQSLPISKHKHHTECKGSPPPSYESSTFEHYEQAYHAFHDRLIDQTFKKLVLSRTLEIGMSPVFSAGETFQRACNKYPDNFIYLLHHEACGTWLGCSPEILLAGQNGQWKTDALAGTIACPSGPLVWDEKNQQEQKIVADYMQQQLASLSIQTTVQPPRTIQSGNLAHLKSEVHFQLSTPNQIFNVLDFLHPSPAVCGSPKKQAFEFILANEGYNRSYYSGFVGNLDFQGKTDLFVNLRCMQIHNTFLQLYAGGGLLPSSDLHSEWKETQHKLQTVSSILE